MVGKRKNVQRFYCPYCKRRLWRLGSPKHYLIYLGALESEPNVDLSRKQELFSATINYYIDSNTWFEPFFCGDHGKLWIRVTKEDE